MFLSCCHRNQCLFDVTVKTLRVTPGPFLLVCASTCHRPQMHVQYDVMGKQSGEQGGSHSAVLMITRKTIIAAGQCHAASHL